MVISVDILELSVVSRSRRLMAALKCCYKIQNASKTCVLPHNRAR